MPHLAHGVGRRPLAREEGDLGRSQDRRGPAAQVVPRRCQPALDGERLDVVERHGAAHDGVDRVRLRARLADGHDERPRRELAHGAAGLCRERLGRQPHPDAGLLEPPERARGEVPIPPDEVGRAGASPDERAAVERDLDRLPEQAVGVVHLGHARAVRQREGPGRDVVEQRVAVLERPLHRRLDEPALRLVQEDDEAVRDRPPVHLDGAGEAVDLDAAPLERLGERLPARPVPVERDDVGAVGLVGRIKIALVAEERLAERDGRPGASRPTSPPGCGRCTGSSGARSRPSRASAPGSTPARRGCPRRR